MMKILGITGIRSDYDLMSSLYGRLRDDPEVDFRLLVGGAHLSRTYGHTIDAIRRDGFDILAAVESLLDSDSRQARLKSAAIFLQGAIGPVADWAPDLIVYAGDREEVWAGALLGTYLGIPTGHFYGGDHTVSGHVDNPVRHAATKLSSAHFVTLEEHRRRILAMGEPEERIFVIGNLSLDNFVSASAIALDDLRRNLGMPCDFPAHAILIFHPDPSEEEHAAQYLEDIIRALHRRGIGVCVGYPNSDPSNRRLIDVIERYSQQPGVFAYRNLGRDEFISLYKHAKFIIGNSSSGILEAASVPIPAINVGLRQRGRFAAHNVIFCDADPAAIDAAIDRATSPSFLAEGQGMKNPYGDGSSGQHAYEILKRLDFKSLVLKPEDALDLAACLNESGEKI
jgi:UDP-hydrolysing UDP-N-acetyl-D-glucosamine 2-epimerase